jgi:hypothetical protein
MYDIFTINIAIDASINEKVGGKISEKVMSP